MIKRIFCFHVYETIDKKNLNKSTNKVQYWCGASSNEITEYFGITQKCMKCNKIKIKEIKVKN